ncbi:hypothetical protein ACNKHV_00550 [Shigella flexneri]
MMRLSLPRLKIPAPAGFGFLRLDFHGAKGLGDRLAGKDTDNPIICGRAFVADLRPRDNWLYRGDLGVDAHRATLTDDPFFFAKRDGAV